MTNKSKLGFIGFYKELDQQEIKLKEEYDKMISIPITALSAMIAGAYFVIDKVSPVVSLCEPFSYFLFVAFICMLGSWLVSSYYFIRFILPIKRAYKVFPKAEDLNNYQDQLIEHFQNNSIETDQTNEFESSFQTYILNTYIFQASHNATINEKRENEYYYFKVFLVISFFILVLISIICLFKIIFS